MPRKPKTRHPDKKQVHKKQVQSIRHIGSQAERPMTPKTGHPDKKHLRLQVQSSVKLVGGQAEETSALCSGTCWRWAAGNGSGRPLSKQHCDRSASSQAGLSSQWQG